MKRFTEKKIKEIQKLYLKGYGISEIGRMFNRDHTTIWYHIKNIRDIPRTLTPETIKDKLKQKELLRRAKEIEINKHTKSTPKGNTKLYKDYLEEQRQREFKKLIDK